jgi:oligopeptide transport system substrate-binding protein
MIDRRTFVGLGATALISCAQSRSEYFGRTTPPSAPKLVHSLLAEPATLDPAKSGEDIESYVIPALFEGLTAYHPQQPKPMAALATHYEASPEQDRFTFYLRGHPAPRGVRLPTGDSLPAEFTNRQKTVSDAIPVCWSDGRRLTAHDFVYSWRRFLDPKTAAPMAYQLYYVKNAEDINTGKLSPQDLGVWALDDFTFQVELLSPTPFFLQLITQYPFSPVPRQALEAARRRGNESSWTEPQHIVVSGPFMVREWRRHEVITAVRNPRYYDANIVRIEELVFPIVADGPTTVKLYRSGDVVTMCGPSFPPLYTPTLSAKKDFHKEPAFVTVYPTISVRKPPFNNLLLRYALNIGTEKKAFTDLLGAGRVPASSLVPPMPGYPAPRTLDVEIDGKIYDVLSFNIEGARALLAKAGFDAVTTPGHRVLDVTYHFPILSDSKLKAEVLQQQWRRNLGIRVNLAAREFNVHWQMVRDRDYSGVADYAFFAPYYDPNPFLEQFSTSGSGNPTGWTDPTYSSMLAEANRTLDPQARMTKLADCEKRLLISMPFVPLYLDTFAYLQKPFVRGLASNPLGDMRAFKYAWIDTRWRPT